MDILSLQHPSDELLAEDRVTLAQAEILRDEDRCTEVLMAELEDEPGYPDMHITYFP